MLLSHELVAVPRAAFAGDGTRPNAVKEEQRSVGVMYHITSGQLILLSPLLFFYRLGAFHI